MAYNYSYKGTENSAKGVGVGLGISRKESYEVCNYIRGKTLQKAKKILEDAIALKKPIPYHRYKHNVGHRAGMAAGRFPIIVCAEILKLLESVESNAQYKGLSTANLVIKHASAQQGPKVWHNGRKRRRRVKRTHVEIILEEQKESKETKETRQAKETVKESKPARETKQEQPKQEKKTVQKMEKSQEAKK